MEEKNEEYYNRGRNRSVAIIIRDEKILMENADVALHSLSASKLGFQYIFKTDKALSKLIPIEKYYLCMPEREECKKLLIERGFEIDTKLRLAKREFKTGLYIEEIFDEKI